MLIIGEMIDDMKEELHYAKKYYKTAANIKEEHPELARKYIELAKAELGHALTLHQMAVETVNRMKENKEDISEYMKECYKEAHDYYIEKYDKIAYLINKFMY